MENMAHLQYLPGDPRLVDQLVCELKSKGIFDQFRKECIADVDTRPAYQNLRQRVESSVATFLSRQCWQPDLNKNQLREKLRKHLLDGNYLEQGVERIVDQVVNPKVATVFIPQVEDLVYNYLGIPRKKPSGAETSNGKVEDLLPTDLEAVSPGSVKSNEDKDMDVEETTVEKMDVDEKTKLDIKEDSAISIDKDKEESRLSGISELTIHDSDVSIDNSTATIPLPAEEIKLENIPTPENSPPNIKNINIDLEKIDLPKEPYLSTDIPLPDEIIKVEADSYFKPIALQSDDDDTSSDSSLRRNMSPLTPIRNFNNENSCDAQQAFENDSDGKVEDNKEPSSFRFTIEIKSPENSVDTPKTEKKDDNSPCQPNTQANVNTFNTPMYDDSSNSNNLQIDYESDANSKATDAKVPEQDQNSVDSKKDRKDDKKSSHKSSHSSRDSHRHSSSKDKERRSDSKHSTSRDSSRHDKSKSSKDDKAKSSHRDKNDKDRGDKKDSRDSSKHRPSSSHKSSSSTSHKDSKHKSSSSKHSSKDDRKSSSSSQRDKEKTSSDKSRDKSKDSKSSSKDKDRKSSKRSDEKENKEKKDKKETDDHYSLSGRGNPNRRSTDRDSNDGSSSSKGSHHPSHTKSGESKKDSKSISKSGSTSSDSTSPSDNVEVIEAKNVTQTKPVVRVDTHLETPVSTPPRLPFVPDVTLKKPRFAANLKEAKEMMKMRKFLEDEQKRMNQEAALLLEFQANVRPSLSQVYSSIPGPELEFACVSNSVQPTHTQVIVLDDPVKIEEQNEVKTDQESKESVKMDESEEKRDEIAETLIAMHCEGNSDMKIDDNDKNMVIDEEIEHDQVFYDNAVEQTEVVQNEEIKEETHASNEGDTVVNKIESKENIDLASKEEKATTDYEVAIVTEELSETEDKKDDIKKENEVNEEYKFQYFTETEKYAAEIEKDKFCNFFKSYTENLNNKFYLINCDTYEENLIKDAGKEIGTFEIVNYIKNGHLKKSASKAIVKNVNVTTEITLPTKMDYENEKLDTNHAMFSPVKSECSFELSSDYDAKLEEMVSKTSKQQVMEIILGGVIDESPSKMPQIDYCSDSNIEENSLKRKCNEIKSSNNNMHVLTPNKMRKLSGSDLISSTTEDTVETPSNKAASVARSKYLGKAKRVGLPKPKRTSNLPSSPSSDKSVENYEQNQTPNGKIKSTPRAKLPQRYDTSDLYKPKLHYLSRRNNIT